MRVRRSTDCKRRIAIQARHTDNYLVLRSMNDHMVVGSAEGVEVWMQRPAHFGTFEQSGSSRLGSAGLSVLLHVAAAFGLIAALNQSALIRQLQIIQAAVETPKEIPRPPPPPPPDFVKPKPPAAIAPEFTVQQPVPSPITTVPTKPAPAQAPPVVFKAPAPSNTPLRPIASTHTLPPYPPIARRLGEQGTTLMEVTITPEGTVGECSVVQSSSSERLDQAGCDFVKSHWRWQPPTTAGKVEATRTRVSIKWDLQKAS